jgi:hypothetical protein
VFSCCNHSRRVIINCNLAYFSKSVNYRFQEEACAVFLKADRKGIRGTIERIRLVHPGLFFSRSRDSHKGPDTYLPYITILSKKLCPPRFQS